MAITQSKSLDESYKEQMQSVNSEYDKLQDNSYRAMLDAEIQLANSKEQAQKYTNVGLRANGMANQGLAESTYTGINNAYMNALQNANTSYNNTTANLGIERQKALTGIEENYANAMRNQSNNDFQAMTTILSGAASTNDLNQTLNNFGLKADENGRIDFSNSNLDLSSQQQLQAMYSQMLNQYKEAEFAQNQTLNGQGFKTSEQAINGLQTSGNFSNELTELFKSTAEEGEVRRIYSNDRKSSTYMIYKGGQWYETSANNFNALNEENVTKNINDVLGKNYSDYSKAINSIDVSKLQQGQVIKVEKNGTTTANKYLKYKGNGEFELSNYWAFMYQ